MKENEAVAESLAFKQNQLSASFQEVANNLISSDLVGHVLDFANALLQLDNETGNVISRILILTGLGWGGTQLLNVSKIIPTISKQFKNFGAVLGALKGGADGLGAAFASVGKGGSALAGFFSSSLPIMLAVAAAITAIVVAVGAIKDAYEKAHRSIADFDGEIGDVNDKLSTNKARLEEIANMPWNERTAEILKEKQAIEDENEKLEEQIELLKEERLERAKKETGSGFDIQIDKRTARLEHGGEIEYGKTYTGADAYSWATTTLQGYNTALKENGQLTDEQMAQYSLINPQIAEQVEWLQLLESSGETLTDEQRALIAAYNEMSMAMELAVDAGKTLMDSYTAIANTGYLTEAQYKKLISLYPDLANGAERTADGYVVQKNALLDLMSAEQAQTAQASALVSSMIAEAQQSGATGQALYDLVAAQITASNTNLNFSQQIAALQALGYQAGLAAAQMNAVFGTNMSSADQVRNRERTIQAYMKQGMSRKQAEAKYLSETQRYLSWSIANTTSKVTSGGGGSYVPKPSGQSAAESARQAQIKALQAEKDQIQDTIDAINKKYDAEIDKLEEVNDELEDEIELQKILEEMAQAKASKKMVYKDGKFQYVEDIDAVAAAQVKLDEYNRKKSLKDAKAAIEERRKIELKGYQDRLAIIEANIKALQNGFSAELGAWDDYLAQLQAKIDEEWRLLNSRPSGGSGGGGYTSTVLPSAPSGLHSNTADPNYKMSAAEAVARRNQGLANAEKANKASAAKKAAAAAAAGAAAGAAGKKKPTTTKKGGSSKSRSSTKYGGRHHAMGTMSADGGFALVGEQGPELRVLNQGDGILPANITRNLWAMATNPQLRMGGSGNISNTAVNVANVTLPNVRNAEEFVAGLKNLAYQRAYARA